MGDVVDSLGDMVDEAADDVERNDLDESAYVSAAHKVASPTISRSNLIKLVQRELMALSTSSSVGNRPSHGLDLLVMQPYRVG